MDSSVERFLFPHTNSTCLSKLPKATIIAATTITTDVRELREKVNELCSRADPKATREQESNVTAWICACVHVLKCVCVCIYVGGM